MLKLIPIESAYGTREEWHHIGTVWGRMAPKRTESKVAYKQAINTEVTHDVFMRHGINIRPGTHRLRWRGTDYEVIERSIDRPNLGDLVRFIVRELDG